MVTSVHRCDYCDYVLERDEIVERQCGYLCRVCVGRVTFEEALRVVTT